MEPILDLAVNLPHRNSGGVLRALHEQLRAAILDSRLKPGLRLPPTRALAKLCRVSRNTAVTAYDLLLSEGYVVTVAGSGTYVADVVSFASQRKPPTIAPKLERRLSKFWRARKVSIDIASSDQPRFDFRLGLPDNGLFPFPVWRRLSARALRALSKLPAAYAEPQGQSALRNAIAKHVSFSRAVACGPEDIVITAGAQQAFDLLARVLVTPGRTVVAIEDPGYRPLRAVLAATGAKIIAVPVDEEGLVVERLPNNTQIIYVTPSHQFPLGSAMSLRCRTALLDFAKGRGAVVIEDDYDSEFRYDVRPLDALQTLDRTESVFYVGTFSKSLFPELRLGFIVTPPWAQRALGAAKQLADWHTAVLAQDTLAAFIAEGHLARHTRKMRNLYGERRQMILDHLRCDFRHWLEPVGCSAGLHLAALSKSNVDTDAIVARAREQGVGIYSLRAFYLDKVSRPGLILGYGAIGAQHIEEGLMRLYRVWKKASK